MKKNFYRSLFLLPAIALLSLVPNQDKVSGYPKGSPPPGTKKLAENFYFDQSDIANVHWREYMYWTKRVFGDTSAEYLASFPDTTLFSEKNPCQNSFITNYLSKPMFNYSPVTGISLEQARAFCQWRSDRVMERDLINSRKIKIEPEQNAQNYFTIEKYFSGSYQNAHPDTAKEYYPQYRLPDANDLSFILKHVVDTAAWNKPPKFDIGTSIYQTAAMMCSSSGEADKKALLTGFRCVSQWKKWGE